MNLYVRGAIRGLVNLAIAAAAGVALVGVILAVVYFFNPLALVVGALAALAVYTGIEDEKRRRR